MIIGTNVFVMPVLHPEALRNDAQRNISKPLIQMPGVDVAFNHRVELQYRESEPFRLVQTVQNQHFSYVLAPV